MTTTYALSYNNLSKCHDILDDIKFPSEDKLRDFMSWFNEVLEAKGKVLIADICQKLRKKIDVDDDEALWRIGFIAPLREFCVYSLNNKCWKIHFILALTDFSKETNYAI